MKKYYALLLDVCNWTQESSEDLRNHILNKLLTVSNIEIVGTDKFIVYEEVDYERFINFLKKTFKEPIAINNEKFYISFRIGIAEYLPYTSKSLIVQNCFLALKRIKNAPPWSYEVYSETLQEQYKIARMLQYAIENNLVAIKYQPYYDIHTGKICGAEALARIKIEGQEISPGKFIPVAEEFGYMPQLEVLILKKIWEETKNLNPMKVSINISSYPYDGKQFEELCYYLEQIACIHDVVLEITEESKFFDKVNNLCSTITKEFFLALDDVGKGYNGINRFIHGIDIVKLDMSYTSQIHNPQIELIVKTLIDLSHKLNLHVIAEGVETEEQLKKLTELRCDCVQGYLISKPIDVLELQNWLTKEQAS